MSDHHAGDPLGIGVKDGIGLACIMIAACGAALGYKILGIAWNVGFAVLGSVGLWLLWSAQRDRRLTRWMIDDACEGDAANYGGGASDGGSVFDGEIEGCRAYRYLVGGVPGIVMIIGVGVGGRGLSNWLRLRSAASMVAGIATTVTRVQNLMSALICRISASKSSQALGGVVIVVIAL